MALDLASLSKMDDQIAIKEAAIASLRSLESVVITLDHAAAAGGSSPFDCRAIADHTMSKFRRFISTLDRAGHARFRRGPVQPAPIPPPPVASPVTVKPHTLTLDFTKPNPPAAGKVTGKVTLPDEAFSISPPVSGNSSFLSSITADGAAGKVTCKGSGSRCHCSKKRKNRLRTSVRVPAISSRIADIPNDSYSWRKYGQKPIKGSPHPSPYNSRAYYKCSSVRGCPARKHVERDPGDASMLVVTYDGEHRHAQQIAAVDATAASIVFES